MATTVDEIFVDMLQVVVNSNKNLPQVGVDYGADGFSWDDSKWPLDDEKKSLSYLPVLWDPARGNIRADSFQSGIGRGTDLEIQDITLSRKDNSYRWFPRLNHGTYYKYFSDRFLYSDESVVDQASNTEDINGNTVSTYDYDFDLKQFIPVSANIYRRNDRDGAPIIDTKIRQRNRFTGIISGGEQLETHGATIQDVIWSSVDTNKDEFVIDRENKKFIFNQDYTERIGELAVDAIGVLSSELVGESSGSSNIIMSTKYFPLVEGSAEVYVYDQIAGTYEEWTIVDNILDEAPGSKVVQLDWDTGSLFFGDEITYGAIPIETHIIYMTYEKSIRIDYEPEFSSDDYTADIDVNPIRLGTNRGFLFLSATDVSLASISLTVRKPLMSENVYGPVYIGGDFALVVATAYGTNGQTFPNTEITFTIDSGSGGLLNGQSAAVTAVTDYRGEAFVYFSSSSGIDTIGLIGTDLSVDGLSLTLDGSVSGLTTVDEVYTFQLRTDDLDMQNGGYRKVIMYEYDSSAVDPNKYQVWLEAGSPRGATTDPDDPYYFLTGGNVPVRPVSVNGNIVTYDASTPLPEITGDVAGYLVTTGQSVTISATATNRVYKNSVHSNPVVIKVQLPTYMTGLFVDHLNNYIYYGFRFADENTFACSSIGTATFLTINPIEVSELNSEFEIEIV